MDKRIAAMKRVVAKRRARGAGDAEIVRCIAGWLSIYKSADMQSQIRQIN